MAQSILVKAPPVRAAMAWSAPVFTAAGTNALAGGLDADDMGSPVARAPAPIPRPSPLPSSTPAAWILIDAIADPVPDHTVRSLRNPDANRFRVFAPISRRNTQTTLVRAQFHWNRHCERSAAISLEQGTLLRERDRHVASLLAMTKTGTHEPNHPAFNGTDRSPGGPKLA